MDNYITSWKEQVNAKPKLRLYRKFKGNFGVEKYCKFYLTRFQRSLLAKLRLGILPLRLETGRFVGEDVTQRICKICNTQVEDEEHFLFKCNYYTEERNSFLLSLNLNNTDDFLQNNTESKLQYLFVNKLFKLGAFISSKFI